MRLPAEARRQFRRCGRLGGMARARRLSAKARRTVARRAAVRRWVRTRFGVDDFASLGLPGAAMVDRGLADLAGEEETVDSLALCLAATRLRGVGVPLPTVRFPDPELRLYRRLEELDGPLAHARFLAREREISSFAAACARLGVAGARRA